MAEGHFKFLSLSVTSLNKKKYITKSYWNLEPEAVNFLNQGLKYRARALQKPNFEPQALN